MEHDQSVEFYAFGMVKMPVVFPHGKVDCRHCPFHKYLEPYQIYQCKLTERFFEKCDLDQRQPFCPVEIQETPF